MLKEAFAVGVVLSVRDLYSNAIRKAQGQLGMLSRTAEAEAAKFERSLRIGQTMVTAGGTITGISAGIARGFESVVDTAGAMQTELDRAMIAVGDRAGVTREQLAAMFSAIKIGWGLADAETGAAYREIGGRTQDWVGALSAVERAAALARERQISLGEATELLTSRVLQQGDAEKQGLGLTERYGNAAAQLSVIQRALGSNAGLLGGFMDRMGTKTKAAGLEFTELGALLMDMGRTGVVARSGMQPFEAMLDAMRELPTTGPFKVVFPKYSKSGSLVDMLDDLTVRLDRIPETTDKLVWLNKVFGTSAEMVLGFTQTLDGIKKSQAELTLAKYADTTRRGNAQMETYSGTQARFNAQMEEFKEMLGTGAIPMVKDFRRTLGDVTQTVTRSPFWRAVLGRGFVIGGLLAELGKLVGPIVSAIGTWKVYHTQQKIAIGLQAQLNTATTGGAIATGAGATVGGAARGGLISSVVRDVGQIVKTKTGLGALGVAGIGAPEIALGVASFLGGIYAGQQTAKWGEHTKKRVEAWWRERTRPRHAWEMPTPFGAAAAEEGAVPEMFRGRGVELGPYKGMSMVTIQNINVPAVSDIVDKKRLVRETVKEVDRALTLALNQQ